MSICIGNTYFAGGKNQTLSGTYYDSLLTVKGCDSIIVTQLTVNSAYKDTVNVNICAGNTYFAGGKKQTVAGTYYDSLFATGGCDSTIVTQLTVNPVYQFSKDTSICFGKSIFAGGQEQTASGIYYDSLLTISNCDSIIATTLTVLHPSVFLGDDMTLCNNENNILYAGNFSSYLWQDGSTETSYPIGESGIYYVSVSDSAGCTARDTIQITACLESELWVPNAFSPNGDGKNEVFRVVYFNITELKAWIFDRWGELIYEWDGAAGGWDGTFKGQQCQDGVYVYVVHAKGLGGSIYDKTGHLTLIK